MVMPHLIKTMVVPFTFEMWRGQINWSFPVDRTSSTEQGLCAHRWFGMSCFQIAKALRLFPIREL